MAKEQTTTGNVVKNTEFASSGDWISRLLTEHCTDRNVGAVEKIEAVKEVKNDKGKVTTKAVAGRAGRKGKDVLDVNAIVLLAKANNLETKEYPNPGMYRMNIGNMLRAAARKRGGLKIPKEAGKVNKKSTYVFTKAPKDFAVNDKITHDENGAKIVTKKEEAA